MTEEDDNWQADAACRGFPTEWWFPVRGQNSTTPTMAKALEICSGCPVKEPCLKLALQYHWNHCPGIWGGYTQGERRRMTRKIDRRFNDPQSGAIEARRRAG